MIQETPSAAPENTPPRKRTSWLLRKYEEHQVLVAATLFLGGFLMDVFFLSEPDNIFSIFQQVTYIFILAIILMADSSYEYSGRPSPPVFKKIQPYSNLIVQFLFGSLLSLYSLYFLKSASLGTSLIFMALMFFLLVANEFPQFQNLGLRIKWLLFSTCLFSYFITLIPIRLGRIGLTPFLLSILAATIILFLMAWRLQRTTHLSFGNILRRQGFAYAALALFVLFYTTKLLPPIPLSVVYSGVYHNVGKDNESDEYLLYRERSNWKFWQSGDQDFYARPDSKVHIFAAIYSPSMFTDKIYMNWMKKDANNTWVSWDRIPLIVIGGRKEGFRGYTQKANFEEGKWRTLIETSDGREIGRISFQVTRTEEPPELRVIRY